MVAVALFVSVSGIGVGLLIGFLSRLAGAE